MLLNESDAGIQILKEEKEYIEQICDQVENLFVGITRRKNPSQIAIVNEVIKKAKSDDATKSEILETLNEREKKVLEIISKNENVSIKELSEQSSISMATAQRFVSQLKDKGVIELVGAGRQRKIRVIENK